MTQFNAGAPPPFQIRPMTLADVPIIVAIEATVMPKAWAEKGYRNELKHNTQAEYSVLEYVVNAAPKIIGYVGHWLMLDEAHISIIALSAEWQGKGFGRLLLLHMLSRAIEQNAVLATLEVRDSNARAQALYTKLGFETVGRRKKYYKDSGEDALLMTVQPLDAAYASQIASYWQTLTEKIGNEFKLE